MYVRYSAFLFGVMLGLGPQLGHAQPVQIPADRSVAPYRWDIGDGLCVTAVHIKNPPPEQYPFSSVDDALGVLNQTSTQWTEDLRVSTVQSVVSFRNSDPVAIGDFSDSILFPFSDNDGATTPNNDRNFAVRVRGYINVDGADPCQLQRTLGLYADDGARMSIGGSLITAPDVDQRLSARRIRQVQYGSGGLYPIELIYYQNGSQAVLELSQSSQSLPEDTKLTNLHDLGFTLLGQPRGNLFANTELYSSRSGTLEDCRECSSDSSCSPGNYCVKDWGTLAPAGLCQQCKVANHCGADCRACGAGAPLCSQGGCVQCLTDMHCPANNRCDQTAHSCRPMGMDWQYFGGCSAVSGSGRGQGPAQLVLLGAAAILLLALYRLRRRRLLRLGHGIKLVPLALLVLWPTGARAELSANTQTFQPAIGPENIITVEGSRTGEALRPLFNVVLDYSQRPLRLVDVYNGQIVANTVPSAMSLHVMAGMGITRWLALAAELPVVVYQGFDRATPVMDVANPPSPYGIGDLRLVAKVRLINNESGGFGLAFVPQATFPTGDPLQLRSNDAYGIEPRLALDYKTPGGAIFALNAGFLGRTANQVLREMEIGSQVRYGLGVYVPLPENFGLMGEVAGGTSIARVPDGYLYSPLEGHVGGRWTHSSGFSVSIGAGTGFTQAVGSPQFRTFASIGYLPIGRKPAAMPSSAGRAPNPGPSRVPAEKPSLHIGIEVAQAQQNRNTLTIEKIGDGQGLVVSEPRGIACGKLCMSSFRMDQELRLTAIPEKDSRFSGWEGPCTGIEPCTLLVRGEPHLKARFIKSQVTITDTKLDLQGRVIHFETAKSAIALDSYYLLDEVALILRQHPQMQLRVEGHTDSVPFYAPGGNNQLSDDRAAAVVQYLVAHGVTGARLSSQGYGDTCPVATNQTPEGRQANRRTEFLLVDQASGKYERTPCVEYTPAPKPRQRKSMTTRQKPANLARPTGRPVARAMSPASHVLGQ